MNYNIVDVADLDCIYLSYDEPQKEEFWLKIKNMVPWAKRVDGRLSTVNQGSVISKLIPDKNEGVECSIEDVSIVVPKKCKVKKIKWKLQTYELR